MTPPLSSVWSQAEKSEATAVEEFEFKTPTIATPLIQ